MVKTVFTALCLCFIITAASAQSLDFQNAVYYTESGGILTSSGTSLSTFNYSSADPAHPIFGNGIFYPVKDSVGNNLWIQVRHIAADPNGNFVGVNVPSTTSSPFRSGGFGGWAGFLYQFDIYRDINLNGVAGNQLDGLFTTKITVESIETLSAGELVTFELLNAAASNWELNSIRFTGLNPTSNPGFSGAGAVWNNSYPPAGFSTTFPQSKNINVVDYGSGAYYAEFRMSATDVSQFKYGYEYTGLSGGYQGMRLYFGTPYPLPLKLTSFNARQQNGAVSLSWNTAEEFNVSHFEIEKSLDGASFKPVGELPFKAGTHAYTQADNDVTDGINYYRLKTVDADGKFSYSGVVKVVVRKKSAIGLSVYPNPVKTNLSLVSERAQAISILDVSGKLLTQVKLHQGVNTINISNYQIGVYFIKSQNNEVAKIIKD